MTEAMVCEQGAIWDLHIHSCKCPKANKEMAKLEIDSYLNGLEAIFNKYQDLQMISFTDHNHISLDVYDSYYRRENEVVLLPGVEIDVRLIDG